jgi:photosystem II stability/assembly factor-like uncharacterized protein
MNFNPNWSNSPNRQPLPCDELINDARINDAFFVNSLSGWAVGDRGIVWHTNDGGKSWELQQTPISCTLKSVWFINEQLGIAVGGYRLPHSNQSKGIIFVTFNGGKNWNTHSIKSTPFFHRVKMFDHLRGIIIGESSEHCPSGIFITKDGGRTWTSHQSDKTNGWLHADFIDEKTGIGIDTQNKIYSTNCNTQIRLPKKQLPNHNNTQFNCIKFTTTTTQNSINGWLVGTNGVILTTTDNGLNWITSAGKLPVGDEIINLNLNTIETIDNNVWAAGSPGTFIYHSADAGKTWKASPSGVNSTIRKIFFVDKLNGWAVGDLGVILATSNGGVTWTTQQIGAKRLAILGVFGKTSEKIPFEVFAQLCANQGYVGGATFVFRDNMKPNNATHNENFIGIDTAHEAMLRVGVGTTSELTAVQPPPDEIQTTYEQLIKQINNNAGEKSLEQIRRKLVCTIRQWQPDIIISTNINSSNINGSNINVTKNLARELTLREIIEAVTLAADPAIFPEQISQLGLSAWQVKKVHLALLDDTPENANGVGIAAGEINIRTAEPLHRLGDSAGETAYISHGLVEREWSPKPAVLGFATPYDKTATSANRDLMSGIESQIGISKRLTILDYSSNWIEVTRRFKKRQYTDKIIRDMIKNAQAKGKSPSEVRLVSHAEELTRKIDRDCAVQTLLEMGRRYHAVGDMDSAAEAYGIIVGQYADHPLAGHAISWTLQYHAAEETTWREFLKNYANAFIEPTINRDAEIHSIETNNFGYKNSEQNNFRYKNSTGGVIQASGTIQGKISPETDFLHSRINFSDDKFQTTIKRLFDLRLDKGLELAEYSRRNFPDLADNVRSRFSWAAMLRRRGFGHEAAKYYQVRGGESYDDVWSMRARAECKLWNGLNGIGIDSVTKNTSMQGDDFMLPSIVAVFTPHIPFLDGEFDNNPACEVQTWSKSKLYSLTPTKPRYRLEEFFDGKRFSSGCSRAKESILESKNFGTRAMFMYDSHHLYIGIRCPKVTGFTYPAIAERARLRDSNISDQDRVEILLDVDRDYSSYYSWVVDSRGWAVDSYFGDKTWNSDCYIARNEDKDAWYIEMAISLDTLSGNLPMSKTAWGIGIRRIVPGVGVECWNAENSLNLNEGLGFLIFAD